MSILDTFYMVFAADSKPLEKGVEEADKKAATLRKGLDATGVSANSLTASLTRLGGAALAAFSLAGASRSLMEAVGYADKLNEQVDRLGLNIETISAWGDAVKKNGGSVEGLISSIEGLNFNLAQMDITGKSRAAPFLKELGINLDDVQNKGKSALDFMPRIADALSKMDKQQANAVGRRLGFDAPTIASMMQGGQALQELIDKHRELGVVTQRQGEIADKFGDQMDDLKHAFRSVWLGVSEYVIPPLTAAAKALERMAVFARKHSDFVTGVMIALGSAVLIYALPPMIKLAAATLLAFAPFILLGAAVTAAAVAFGLLFDDVMAFIDGGDSMTGAVIDWVSQLNIFGRTGEYLSGVWRGITNAFTEFLERSPYISAAFDGMAFAINGVIEALKFVLGLFKSVGSAAGEVFKSVGGVGFFGGGDPLRSGMSSAQSQLSLAASTPLAAQTSSSIFNGGARSRTTSVQVGKVEVHTQATDAAGISRAIGNTLSDQMRQVAVGYDDGVLG